MRIHAKHYYEFCYNISGHSIVVRTCEMFKHLSDNECLMVQRCKDKIQMFCKIRIQTDRMK